RASAAAQRVTVEYEQVRFISVSLRAVVALARTLASRGAAALRAIARTRSGRRRQPRRAVAHGRGSSEADRQAAAERRPLDEVGPAFGGTCRVAQREQVVLPEELDARVELPAQAGPHVDVRGIEVAAGEAVRQRASVDLSELPADGDVGLEAGRRS